MCKKAFLKCKSRNLGFRLSLVVNQKIFLILVYCTIQGVSSQTVISNLPRSLRDGRTDIISMHLFSRELKVHFDIRELTFPKRIGEIMKNYKKLLEMEKI